MAGREISIHGQWSSFRVFVLALTGSAVGLGNIWKFGYMAGENGGGAFILVYLLCLFAIGVPVMVAEILIGRRGGRNPIGTMHMLAAQEGRSPWWQSLGWASVAGGFLVLSYYSVISGWALAYVFRVAGGMFKGATQEGVSSIFVRLISAPERLLVWHTLFMLMTVIVVARGVRHGLEWAVRFLMPALLALLVVALIYSMNSGAFMQGYYFLFMPDFSRLTATAVLSAMTYAFFTLHLGMGAVMAYSAYLPRSAPIIKASFLVALLDMLVGLLAGLAIFPLVFFRGMKPDGGPALMFQVLPDAFGHLPGGALFGTLFFIALVLAAWTSSISMLEPTVAWLVENRGMSRISAAAWSGAGAWLLGIGTVFSFNITSTDTLWGRTFFDLIDFVTANTLLPLVGLGTVVFTAWAMAQSSTRDELALGEGYLYRTWRVLARYVAPLALLVIFLHVTGVLGHLHR